MILKMLFWISLSAVFYCYFAYPFLLYFLAKIKPCSIDKQPKPFSVCVLLAVWNEEDVIEAKLNNLLSLNYPSDDWHVWIGSDGSDDKTCEIIRRINSPRVTLIEHQDRRGKMLVLNALMEQVHSEVVVFTDARQEFARDAIIELSANFADDSVGCVSGELIFRDQAGGTAKGVGVYWRYEKMMRQAESRLHSMLGATGAIYAIRSGLYCVIPHNIILDDMYVPLKIIQAGYRAVFDGSAKAYDDVADNPQEEHRRKTRTLFGNYQIFGLFASLFNPLKSPVAIQLFSHKLLRVMVPFLLIVVFFLNGYFAYQDTYQALFLLQCIFYLMAVIGCLARNKNCGKLSPLIKLCYIAYVFCLLNFSALSGFVRFILGRQQVTWRKARRSE